TWSTWVASTRQPGSRSWHSRPSRWRTRVRMRCHSAREQRTLLRLGYLLQLLAIHGFLPGWCSPAREEEAARAGERAGRLRRLHLAMTQGQGAVHHVYSVVHPRERAMVYCSDSSCGRGHDHLLLGCGVFGELGDVAVPI